MLNRPFLYLVIASMLMFSGCFIQGRVVDENGVGIAGVTVTLNGDLSRTTTTDTNGNYRFGELRTGDIIPAGSYTVIPSKSGYSFVPFTTNCTVTDQSIGDLADIPGPDLDVDFVSDSKPVFDQWVRTSQYVEVRDGTKLAVDIFRPSHDGTVPVDEPLPVVFQADPYHRADIEDGELVTVLDKKPILNHILRHGYVISCLDLRGSGASYGTRTQPTS
ncbi:MAG: hypothetical protein GY850_17300, partial [bacterium]|nr:hypothetical protein [bacterium]